MSAYCPFCHSINLSPGTYSKERPFRGIDTPGHVIGCCECEAATEILPTREDARDAWREGRVLTGEEFWEKYAPKENDNDK